MDSPTSRALLALELLQAAPGITADRLALRLGVSSRAARRYVALLREAGLPIDSTRGPHGGYRVGRGHRPPPLMFTEPEALGLVMALLDGHRDTAADAALAKLVRALPEPASTVLRQAATGAGPRDRPDPSVTSDLVRACADRRAVRIHYRPRSGPPFETDVEPWSVVVRHGRWYLLCLSRHAAARRALRVDRIGTVTPLAGTVALPAELDPVAALEEHLATGWTYAVEVLIEAPLPDVAARMPPSLGRLEPAGPARCRLLATTDDPRWYAQQLTAFPVPIRVQGGPELLDAVRSMARALSVAAGFDAP